MRKILSVLLLLALVLPSAAHAESPGLSLTAKRAKIVGKAALYGFGGGLVVGIASQVVKKKAKNVFLFGSLGLYAGIALGIYVISTSKGPAPYEGPDTYEDYGDFSRTELPPTSTALVSAQPKPGERDGLSLNLLNLKF